jgi:2-isopropylmalate synthase
VELVKLASTSDEGIERITATIRRHGVEHEISGVGNGPVSAFCDALSSVDLGWGGLAVRVLDYHEHALTSGRDAEAAAYLEIEIGEQVLWGVGISESTTQASLRAVISGVNRVIRSRR